MQTHYLLIWKTVYMSLTIMMQIFYGYFTGGAQTSYKVRETSHLMNGSEPGKGWFFSPGVAVLISVAARAST